jgi:GTP-binding protein
MTGEGVSEIMPEVGETLERWNLRVPTAALNRWLEEALARHAPPIAKGRRLKLRYITQAKTRPPGFILFTTRPAEVPEDYLRYLTNSLREAFGLGGIPIRLLLRKGKNPYADSE